MPRLPWRPPTYSLPPVTLSTFSSRLEGWENFNAVYGRNLQELELPNPYIRMTLVSTQAITAASLTSPSWETESTIFPRQSMDPIITGTTYIEVPFDGLWSCDAHVRLENVAAAAGGLLAHIQKISGRGSTGIIAREHIPTQVGAGGAANPTASVPLYKGDRITVQAIITDGGDANAHASGDLGSWLAISGIGIRGST